MDNQEELSHKQSFELIEEMIYKAKNSYHESGTSALLWGGTIMFCSTVSFVNTWLKIDWLYMVWWLTFLALIPQIIISIRESKTQKFKLHTDEPCSNLDAKGIELYHSLINNYCKERLVIVCSNDPVEYRFCNEAVSIMDFKRPS